MFLELKSCSLYGNKCAVNWETSVIKIWPLNNCGTTNSAVKSEFSCRFISVQLCFIMGLCFTIRLTVVMQPMCCALLLGD